MNQRKWTQNEIYDFLLLYKKHECLWNVKKASYANTALRDAAFSDIAAKMLEHKIYGLGPEEIKRKFSNLQSTYYHVRFKQNYSSVSPSKRKWYEIMEHLVKNSKTLNKPGKKNLDDKLYIVSKKSRESEASSSTIKPAENQEDACLLLQKEMDHINVQLPLVSSVKLQSRIEILSVLKKIYSEKKAPDYSLMFQILTKVIRNDSCLTSSVEELQLEMNRLGYLCKETIYGKKMIIENAEQRFERYLYLTKIRKMRTERNRQIIYIDERILNSKLNYEKVNNLSDGLLPETSVFFHAISKDGFYKGLFVNQASKEDFNKWVVDILLSSLTPPCVIIMDNGPLHGTLEDTLSITRYSTKIEMLKWLNNNNIPCTPNMAKPELFELIRKNKRENKEYKIDGILRSHGHEVLRLPNSFPDLNMTHILWNAISEGKVLPKTASQQTLQEELIDNILPSIAKKKWSDFEKILIMKENDIFEIDVEVLFYSTNGFRDSSGEKKMNLRIGFDLTQGENGAPSLRIRDFEESSEFNPRAVEEDAANDKKSSPSVRADSFSDSSEMVTNNAAKDRYESSKERDRSNDKSDDDDSNDSDRRISTRGLVPGEYEPEENARIHPKFQESSESDSERPRRRHKRSISLKGLMANLKNKSRQFFNAERRQVSTP